MFATLLHNPVAYGDVGACLAALIYFKLLDDDWLAAKISAIVGMLVMGALTWAIDESLAWGLFATSFWALGAYFVSGILILASKRK